MSGGVNKEVTECHFSISDWRSRSDKSFIGMNSFLCFESIEIVVVVPAVGLGRFWPIMDMDCCSGSNASVVLDVSLDRLFSSLPPSWLLNAYLANRLTVAVGESIGGCCSGRVLFGSFGISKVSLLITTTCAESKAPSVDGSVWVLEEVVVVSESRIWLDLLVGDGDVISFRCLVHRVAVVDAEWCCCCCIGMASESIDSTMIRLVSLPVLLISLEAFFPLSDVHSCLGRK